MALPLRLLQLCVLLDTCTPSAVGSSSAASKALTERRGA